MSNQEKKTKLVFDRINYILLAAGLLAVILGFALMTGSSTSMDAFEPDIFSFRRIRLAPVICLLGFVSMIVSILYKPKKK